MSQRLAHALWMPREHTTSLERKSSLQPGASCIWGSPPKACTAGQQGGPQLGDVCANPQQWKQLVAGLMSPGWAATQCWGLCFPVTFQSYIPPLTSLPPTAPTPGFSRLSPLLQRRSRVGRKDRTLDRESGDLGPATALLCDL